MHRGYCEQEQMVTLDEHFLWNWAFWVLFSVVSSVPILENSQLYYVLTETVKFLSEVRIEGLETLDYFDNLKGKERFTEQGDAIVFESEVSKPLQCYIWLYEATAADLLTLLWRLTKYIWMHHQKLQLLITRRKEHLYLEKMGFQMLVS